MTKNVNDKTNVLPFVPRPAAPAPPAPRPSLTCLELSSDGRELTISVRDPAGGCHAVGPYQLRNELAGLVMAWLRAAWNDRREDPPEVAS